MTDLNHVRELDTMTLSMPILNQILQNAQVKVGFTGKRTVIFGQSFYSLKNPYCLCKTSFEALSKALAVNLHKYPITVSRNFDDMSFFEKFDLTPENELTGYKENLSQTKEALEKITGLDNSSKEIIKKSNVITRIFFYISQFFNTIFYFNLKKATKFISQHETLISQNEKLLIPVKKYHTVSKTMSITGNLMIATNIFLQILGVPAIPYVSKTLNIAMTIAIMKIAYSHMSSAINKI